MELRKINDTTYVNVGTGNITSVVGGGSFSGGSWVKVNFLGGTSVEITGKTLAGVVVSLMKEA